MITRCTTAACSFCACTLSIDVHTGPCAQCAARQLLAVQLAALVWSVSDQHSLAGHDHLDVHYASMFWRSWPDRRPEDVAPPEHQTSAVGTSTEALLEQHLMCRRVAWGLTGQCLSDPSLSGTSVPFKNLHRTQHDLRCTNTAAVRARGTF
jgi:hypothetical protein